MSLTGDSDSNFSLFCVHTGQAPRVRSSSRLPKVKRPAGRALYKHRFKITNFILEREDFSTWGLCFGFTTAVWCLPTELRSNTCRDGAYPNTSIYPIN